jgi:hypothetical protein
MAGGMRWDDPHRDPTTRRAWRPDEIGPSAIRARFEGTCSRCGRKYKAGVAIQRSEGVGWVHASCPKGVVRRKSPETCPVCFVIKSASGGCLCT